MLISLYFDSVEEMIAKAIPSEVNREAAAASDFSHSYRLKDWLGFSTSEELIKTINTGWKEGVEKATEFKRLIEKDIPPIGVKRKKKHSDDGSEIDLERYTNREFDSMFTTQEKVFGLKTNTPITIHASIGGNCGRSVQDFFWKGALVTVLVDMLEEAGYRVKVIGFSHSIEVFQYPDPNFYFEMLLKDFNDPLNFERLITTTALGGFYRWYGFKTKWSVNKRVKGGLGRTVEYLPTEVKTDILISNVYDKQNSIEMANEIIDRLIIRR